MIVARDLRFAWPGLTLSVTLSVAPGERVALTGPSGTGKSTVLALLSGHLRGTGTLTVDGQDPRSPRGHWRLTRLGQVLQLPQLWPRLTALDNVLLPLRCGPGVSPEHRTHAAALLDTLEVPALAPGGALSVGEQQRVAVARALVARPVVVLADEPTASLDPARAEVVRTLFEGCGAAVLWSSHDPAVAARCDRSVDVRDWRAR